MSNKKSLERAEIIAALRDEAERHPDVWLYKDAADALAALQSENAGLMDEIRGYCWCCTHAEIWDKALPGSLTRTCQFLREQGVAAGGGRRKCQHWKWRGAHGEA